MNIEKNKKLYIILTPRITGLGGAQLYTLRRSRQLLKNGYNLLIVTYSDTGNFFLKDNFEKDNIPILKSSLFKYPISVPFLISRIIKLLIPFITPNTKIIIESHTRELASWGELISEYFNGFHFIYLLDEPVPSFHEKYQYYPYLDFFEFKLYHKQFVGLSESFISLCFNKPLPSKTYINIGIDVNEIAHISEPSLSDLKDKLKDSIVFGTLTRLEKQYLIPSIYALIDYAKAHSDKKFAYIVAGGSSDKQLIDFLKKQFESEKSLRIIFTDYLSPVGMDFYELLNLFIGQGTAAVYAISAKVPAILMDREGENAYGFLGHHVSSFAYFYNPVKYALNDILDFYFSSADMRSELPLISYNFFNKEYLASNCFKKYDVLIDSVTNQQSKYFKLDINLKIFFNDIKTFLFRKIKRFSKKYN
jgi:hypothetical protein